MRLVLFKLKIFIVFLAWKFAAAFATCDHCLTWCFRMAVLYNHPSSPFPSRSPEKVQVSRQQSANYCQIPILPRPCLTPFSSKLPEKARIVHRYGLISLCQHPSEAPLSPSFQEKPVVVRRKINYHPTLWDRSFIESLPPSNQAFEASNKQRVEDLKEKVVHMFKNENDPFARMNLVDTIQRHGLAHYFEKEIQTTLQQAYYESGVNDNLHAAALRFRLLRQEGYHVPCDVFDRFKDKDMKFKENLRSDVRGLLSLYEASHYSIEGEDILDEALTFTSEHLKSICIHSNPSLARNIEHALALSLHKGMSRLETMHYIYFYEEDETKSGVLLELAKLDFNLVQSLHLSEIKEVSKWHKEIDFMGKLAFGRNQVVESHACSVEMNFLPQFSNGRISLSKFYLIITQLDDIYNAYGTLDELELFTAAINRWKLSSMDQLPYYMKLCYLVLYNLVNEIEYRSINDRGNGVIYYLKKMLKKYCNALMQEARWFYDGHVPSLDEYLSVASTTIGGPILILFSTIGMGELATTHAIEYIIDSKLLRLITLNARLINDLRISKDEQSCGVVIKSIQCYMKEKDTSEEGARIHIKNLITKTWKEINKELLKSTSLPKPILKGMVNYVRLCETFYQNKKNIFANSKCLPMDCINSLFFKNLPMSDWNAFSFEKMKLHCIFYKWSSM